MLDPRPLLLPAPDRLRGPLEVERNLRDQDDVCAAGNSRVQGDPSRVTPHHFDHHDSRMSLGGGSEPVDRLRRTADRSVEPERAIRANNIVVDRLRYADDRHSQAMKPVSDVERAVPPDYDQRLQPEPPKCLKAGL